MRIIEGSREYARAVEALRVMPQQVPESMIAPAAVVRADGTVVAVVPTWADGELLADALPDTTVLRYYTGEGPRPTDRGHREALARLAAPAGG